jgi:hypothetical protein
MVFPIAGGNESKGYEISNSLRFNDGDSPILTRNPSSAGDGQKFTYSTWFKRSVLGAEMHPFLNAGSNASNYFRLNLSSGDAISSFSISGGSTDFEYVTTQVFRDPSAWYHLVFAVDTTNGTAANRVRFYINGSEITSFSTETNPSQNLTTDVNGTTAHYIGRRTPGNDSFYDGYLTETHLVDGQQLAPTSFGEFDDNGVWIPIKYTGTYGTNGFFLQFKQTGTSQNSSGIGADTSGNDNHYAVTNFAATDITEDTCTNNFATINPLANQFNPAALSEGNTRVDFDNGTSTVYNISTIGVSSGKWYCEIKAVTIPDYAYIGIASRPCIASGNSDALNANQYNYGYAASDGNVKSNNSAGVSYGATYDDGDIIGIALDLDNNKLYFSKNGTFQNSGDPTSGSTGTGAVSIEAPSGTIDGVYYFAVGDNRNSHDTRMDCNFGNPAYSISSGNNDGKYGNFEYAPPSGYYALCTKRLAEFG